MKGSCYKCGKETEGKFSKLKQKVIFYCGSCFALGLASLMEEECPGDTLKDISEGEQVGAWLRSIVK